MYQARIDGIQAGAPFEADNDRDAAKYAALMYDAAWCGESYLTVHGETVTAVRVETPTGHDQTKRRGQVWNA